MTDDIRRATEGEEEREEREERETRGVRKGGRGEVEKWKTEKEE